MQQPNENRATLSTQEAAQAFNHPERQLADAPTMPPTVNMQEVARAAERARLRQLCRRHWHGPSKRTRTRYRRLACCHAFGHNAWYAAPPRASYRAPHTLYGGIVR